ncbi:hypothetical protein HC931_09545 [Candidatus Gracilibacteria bacterium]|nr:hypothetical protein [Candidatus Gracilibacteria bacterium]
MKKSQKKLDLIIKKIGSASLWINTILGFFFLYIPIVILVIYSFNTSRFNAVWRGFTLNWYRSLLTGVTDGRAQITDLMIWDAVNNSLVVAIALQLLQQFWAQC